MRFLPPNGARGAGNRVLRRMYGFCLVSGTGSNVQRAWAVRSLWRPVSHPSKPKSGLPGTHKQPFQRYTTSKANRVQLRHWNVKFCKDEPSPGHISKHPDPRPRKRSAGRRPAALHPSTRKNGAYQGPRLLRRGWEHPDPGCPGRRGGRRQCGVHPRLERTPRRKARDGRPRATGSPASAVFARAGIGWQWP